MIDDGDLDTLLAAPLADVADDGFSSRVMTRAHDGSGTARMAHDAGSGARALRACPLPAAG